VSTLHHERVQSTGATPRRWAFVLHGVFGSGANWRLFMRRLSTARPDWGFVLVDLRGHGRSPMLPPPHDLDAMVGDLHALEATFGEPVDGVIGHSLGGKVALAYAATRPDALDSVWVLDSQPGPRNDGDESLSHQVLELLEALPPRFADRNRFVALVEEAGQSRPVAAWLAMSLVRDGADFRLGMDLAAIRSILEDYYRRDLWPEVERADRHRHLHVVVAGRSYVWQSGDRARLRRIAATPIALDVQVIEDAGHWLHVDVPDELHALFVAGLRR
jgi:pimeloyl-ACP methyl ester carboxylesterase